MSELSDKALAFWNLDEAFDHAGLPTTATDQVGSGNDLTNGGLMASDTGVCGGTAAMFWPGQVGSSLARASTTALRSGWVHWTGWAYSVAFSSGSGTPWFCKCGVFPANSDYELFQFNDVGNTVAWLVRNSADTTTASANAGAPVAGWNFFDCYWNGSTEIGLSLNRGAYATASLTTRKETASDFALGRNPGVGSYHFNSGRMSNLGCWGSRLSDAELDYLFGSLNGGCPPEWPFDDAPGSGIAFEAYAARLMSDAPYANAAYGTKTYFIISNPVSGREYRVTNPLEDLNNVQPGEKIALKIRRDGDDPNDPSTGRASLETVSLDYYTKFVQ